MPRFHLAIHKGWTGLGWRSRPWARLKRTLFRTDCQSVNDLPASARRFPLRPVAFFIVDRVRALVEASKNHLARGGLQYARHRDVDGFRNHLARVVHYHHGAVVEVGDA